MYIHAYTPALALAPGSGMTSTSYVPRYGPRPPASIPPQAPGIAPGPMFWILGAEFRTVFDLGLPIVLELWFWSSGFGSQVLVLDPSFGSVHHPPPRKRLRAGEPAPQNPAASLLERHREGPV